MAEIEVIDGDITAARRRRDRQRGEHRAAPRRRRGGAISRAGGPAIQRESDEAAPIELGAAVATGAGELPARWVIHAATMHLGGPTSAEIIGAATESTLRVADELGARSLALVAFGTGVGGFPLAEAAPIEVDAARRPPGGGQRARADRLLRARRRGRRGLRGGAQRPGLSTSPMLPRERAPKRKSGRRPGPGSSSART